MHVAIVSFKHGRAKLDDRPLISRFSETQSTLQLPLSQSHTSVTKTALPVSTVLDL